MGGGGFRVSEGVVGVDTPAGADVVFVFVLVGGVVAGAAVDLDVDVDVDDEKENAVVEEGAAAVVECIVSAHHSNVKQNKTQQR